MRLFGLILFSVSFAGCFRAIPLETSNLRAGSEAELFLTDLGTLQLSHQLGAQLESVRGNVAEADDKAIVLFVKATTNRSGTESLWRGERVPIPREYVKLSSIRKLDRKRTTIVTLLSLLGVVVAGSLLGGGTGFDGFIGGGGGGRQ